MTKLRQLLETIENADRGISLQEIARELDISLNRAENMLEYWVRKGRLQIVEPASGCSDCSSKGSCSYLLAFPKILRIAGEDPSEYSSEDMPCQ